MSDPVAIITGAASGIGRHWAKTLLNQGSFRLILADINDEGLKTAFTPADSVRLHTLDIRQVDHWQRLVADTLKCFGRIDYLFNIAGGGNQAFFLQQPIQNFEWVIDINLKGPLIGMKVVGDVMVSQKSGHIINVGSLAGLSATPGNALYSAAKSGLRNASIAAAIEWRKQGVAVTVISPDLVDTPLMQKHLENGSEAVALTYTGVTLTVYDLEKAFRKAMRTRQLEMNLPRWRGWLVKLNHMFPSLMVLLYEPMKKRGMKRFASIRNQRLGGED